MLCSRKGWSNNTDLLETLLFETHHLMKNKILQILIAHVQILLQ